MNKKIGWKNKKVPAKVEFLGYFSSSDSRSLLSSSIVTPPAFLHNKF